MFRCVFFLNRCDIFQYYSLLIILFFFSSSLSLLSQTGFWKHGFHIFVSVSLSIYLYVYTYTHFIYKHTYIYEHTYMIILVFVFEYLFHMRENVTFAFLNLLMSLHMMFSSSTHLPASDKIGFCH
jgi:hypothetical protein